MYTFLFLKASYPPDGGLKINLPYCIPSDNSPLHSKREVKENNGPVGARHLPGTWLV